MQIMLHSVPFCADLSAIDRMNSTLIPKALPYRRTLDKRSVTLKKMSYGLQKINNGQVCIVGTQAEKLSAPREVLMFGKSSLYLTNNVLQPNEKERGDVTVGKQPYTFLLSELN